MSKLSREEEKALWYKYKNQGDSSAFESLMKQYEQQIQAYILLRIKNKDDAQDIFQDVFRKFAFSNYKAEKPLKPFLYRIAENEINSFKRKWRRFWSKQDNVEDWIDFINDPAKNSVDSLFEQESLLLFESALLHLKESHQTLIRLIDILGHSYKEAAEIIGITENKLKRRLENARKKLKKVILSNPAYKILRDYID